MLGFFVLLVALIGAAIGGSPKIVDHDDDDMVDFRDWPIRSSPNKHLNGHLEENSGEDIFINITEKYVTKITIELNWLDEADKTGLGDFQNKPDSFNFTVYTPWGLVVSSDDILNPPGGAGLIVEEVMIPEEVMDTNIATGEWRINVHCGNCGDQEPRVSIIGIRVDEDTGNDWALSYQFDFHTNN